MLGRVVTFGQIGIAAVMLAGDQIFQALAMPPPPLYLQLREKKTGVLMGTWIVGNMIQNSLSATGAFEVYSNGELVRLHEFPSGTPALDQVQCLQIAICRGKLLHASVLCLLGILC